MSSAQPLQVYGDRYRHRRVARRTETVVAHIAETFEQSGNLLSRFSGEQLNQGFWYLFYEGDPDFMGTLLDVGVPLAYRLRALRSFVPLFEQVMAQRCSLHLSHIADQFLSGTPGLRPEL